MNKAIVCNLNEVADYITNRIRKNLQSDYIELQKYYNERKENKMKNYEEKKELTYKYLDKIPWDKVLNTYDYIEDIFEDISTKYSDELDLPKEFYGDIFNFMNIEDFRNYLEERNICNIDEEIKIIPYISKINYGYIEDLKKQNE